MKKLVKLDSEGWLTEIDRKALHREALALKAYIEASPAAEEKIFRYRDKVLPLVKAALMNMLEVPYKGDDPYSWRLMLEGVTPVIPNGFSDHYSKFLTRIRGSPMMSAPSFLRSGKASDYVPEVEEIDGYRYEWVEFED